MCPLCIGAIAAGVAGLGILSKGKGDADARPGRPPAGSDGATANQGPSTTSGPWPGTDAR